MSLKKVKDFYLTPTEASEQKQRIVVKYHAAWAQVLRSKPADARQKDLAYVDLFAGQGAYDDGSPSTPLLILETAARDKYMREHLITIFNEGDPNTFDKLQQNVANSRAAKLLRHYPKVTCAMVEQDILHEIGGVPRCPTLLFADPWGYKGLSLELLGRFLKGFGNDLIFFLNYKRINSAIANSVLEEPIDAVFGKAMADKLRGDLAGLKGVARENVIMAALERSFKDLGARSPVRYRFVSEGRSSHYLMFVSKHPLGTDIMKSVMAAESERDQEGVAKFEFDPRGDSGQQEMFPASSLDDLATELARKFRGQIFSGFDELYHRSDHPRFGQTEHKRALRILERKGLLSIVSYTSERIERHGELSIPSDATLVFK